jgi:hypothetical protein
MTNKEITHAARQICADQCEKQDNSDGQLYLSGLVRIFRNPNWASAIRSATLPIKRGEE